MRRCVTGSGPWLHGVKRLWLAGFSALLLAQAAEGRTVVDLSGAGWNLWRDRDARWREDVLFAPPVDLEQVPSRPPTGGWEQLAAGDAVPVSVPGTVEEYLGAGNGPADFRGVSWWTRTIRIPATAGGQRVLLRFASARQRAEIYIDGKPVGYDVVGNSPFEVDISDAVTPGGAHRLAVRITNPGGLFSWVDFQPIGWGPYRIPMSHNFSGITGEVKLLVCDHVYIEDVYIQNTPAITNVNVIMSVRNVTGTAARRDVSVAVRTRGSGVEEAAFTIRDVELAPGDNTVTRSVSVADAALWDTEHPNLYRCEVSLLDADAVKDTESRTFGFRWFDVDGIGTDAVFRLNGKRMVLRSAISWGFWPINGIYPTPEWAERQVRTAKAMGLNMLNFHRGIGTPIVMDIADELGLLIYEEPGGYVSPGEDPFGMALAGEKLLRMVKRDRSHPCLVIYNMINEQWWLYGAPDEKGPVFAQHLGDMTRVHALDPSRLITYVSGWAEPAKEQRIKLHMRPFDDTLHYVGWYDFHNAGGPEVWRSEYYQGPAQMYNYTDNRAEIVFWGEEGAMSSPPRLEKIQSDLAKAPNPGWDGGVYKRWYHEMDAFLTEKGLRPYFPSVDALCLAMGAVSHEHQGRKIENIRVHNVSDGYAINGWEGQIVENHSGVVDCFRYPKGDPAIMAYYNQPLYVAVKCRNQVVEAGERAEVDCFLVNERNLTGQHRLRVTAVDASGTICFSNDFPVSVTGGDVYGELLAEGVHVPIPESGLYRIGATLLDPAGRECASGREEILGVDWRASRISTSGAIYEQGTVLRDFLAGEKHMRVPAYANELGRLDWVLLARGRQSMAVPVPAGNLRDATGQQDGLRATFFSGRDFADKLHERTDRAIDFVWPQGSTPDPAVTTTQDYSVRWEGSLVPPTDGAYTVAVKCDDGARLWIDGSLVIDQWRDGIWQPSGTIALEANRPVSIKLEYYQAAGGAEVRLLWLPPDPREVDLARLMARVRNDGTTLLITDSADDWLHALKDRIPVRHSGVFDVGMHWNGGQYFVREHPLFKDLPVNRALSWPYELLVREGHTRQGLILEGEELVAGCHTSQSGQLGTAVGIVPSGKGKIVISTLRITDSIQEQAPSVHVVKKLLCNYLEYASNGTGEKE